MRLESVGPRQASRPFRLELMRDELYHALVEALYELDVLPRSEDGAVVGLYAVMDDLETAIRRTEALDPGATPDGSPLGRPGGDRFRHRAGRRTRRPD